MGGMHRVGEHHRLVVGQRLQQRSVGVDEGLLFGWVELARHGCRPAVLQAMQQRDQPGSALVDDPECVFDPRSDLAGRQGFADPRLQRRLLLQGQVAGPAPVGEPGQPIHAVFLEQAMPCPDRVGVDQQHPADLVATHPAIQQYQRVRPPSQTMFSQPVPSQQVLPFLRCQKAAANHGSEKILPPPAGKRFFRHLTESRYAMNSATPCSASCEPTCSTGGARFAIV